MTKIVTNPFRSDAIPPAVAAHYSGQQEAQEGSPASTCATANGQSTTTERSATRYPNPSGRERASVRPRRDPHCGGANRLPKRTAPAAQRLLDAYAAYDSPPRNPTMRCGRTSTRQRQPYARHWPTSPTAQPHRRVDTRRNQCRHRDDITADMTDQDVQDYADTLLSDLAADSGAGMAVCDGLYEYLIEERDSKRASETV